VTTPTVNFRPPRRFAGAAALTVSISLLAACNSFNDHRSALERDFAQGHYADAAADLDKPQTREEYADKNALLWMLDRGALAVYLDDPATALSTLEDAERHMEKYNAPDAGDVIAQWALNDTAARYIGEPYEDIYVNVLKLLAQLESGNIDGGATVEARRLAAKADTLRDRYITYRDALAKQGGEGFSTARTRGDLVSVNEEGRFIESPLGTYLTAATFMASRDTELQRVASRRLLDSIKLQGTLIGPVNPAHFQDLEDRPVGAGPDRGTLLAVALSGRGPTMHAMTVGPIPVFEWPVYFQLPELKGGEAEVASVRARVADPSPGASFAGEALPAEGSGDTLELALVEDMRAVATENHRRELPLIYARTLLRSSIKSGISFAATKAMQHNAHGDTETIATIGMVLAGLAVLALTEQADLRCWIFLPALAHVGMVDLPAGDHYVRAEYLSSSGGVVYTSPWKLVHVPTRGLGTTVTQYWK
jgi:hypothetical protein